jgi:hypothetical protein
MMQGCAPAICNVCQLTGPFFLEQRLTDGNYLNFLTNELLLFLDNVFFILETGRRSIFLKTRRGASFHILAKLRLT